MNRARLLIILAVIVLVGGFVGYRYSRSIDKSSYKLVTVQRGDIVQEVFASGKVESPTNIDLRFENSGRLTVLKAKVGNKVTTGQLLAKQDTDMLDAQLAEAQAGIEVQKTKLAIAKEDAVNADRKLVDAIQSAFVKADDAVRNQVDELFGNPETSPSFGISFTSGNTIYAIDTTDPNLKLLISSERRKTNDRFRAWPFVTKEGSVETLSKDAQTTQESLEIIEKMLNDIAFAINNLSSSDAIVNEVYNNFKRNISTARANVSVALSDLITAKTGSVSLNNIAQYETQVRQAEASMEKIRVQIQDREMVAPEPGIVTATNGDLGEIVDPNTVVVSLISDGPPQVKVNLSEDNVANVKVGQPVRITVGALSKDWQGTVAEIDPASTIVNGSVYYKVVVAFNELNNQVKVGMTADVWIKTGTAKKILFVPASAIRKNDQGPFVEIYENGAVSERNVVTGLKGQDGVIEVVSGLAEGEQAVIGNQ